MLSSRNYKGKNKETKIMAGVESPEITQH